MKRYRSQRFFVRVHKIKVVASIGIIHHSTARVQSCTIVYFHFPRLVAQDLHPSSWSIVVKLSAGQSWSSYQLCMVSGDGNHPLFLGRAEQTDTKHATHLRLGHDGNPLAKDQHYLKSSFVRGNGIVGDGNTTTHVLALHSACLLAAMCNTGNPAPAPKHR